MLRNLRGEEHLLLRHHVRAANASILPLHLLSSLTRFAIMSRPPPTFIRSYYEDATLSRRTVGMSEADELKDLARLLTSLWEAAQRLPEGSERQDAFRQIGSFHRRVAVIVTGALQALRDVASAVPWLPIQLAPEDCDLEVGELDKTGIMPLGFPCRRKLGVWYNAWADEPILICPTHWRIWRAPTSW